MSKSINWLTYLIVSSFISLVEILVRDNITNTLLLVLRNLTLTVMMGLLISYVFFYIVYKRKLHLAFALLLISCIVVITVFCVAFIICIHNGFERFTNNVYLILFVAELIAMVYYIFMYYRNKALNKYLIQKKDSYKNSK